MSRRHHLSGDGGYLTGSSGGVGGVGGGVGGGDGWTMMLVAVVVAVILGTAVASLILVVRKWLLKWSDSSSHHLIVAPTAGANGSGLYGHPQIGGGGGGYGDGYGGGGGGGGVQMGGARLDAEPGEHWGGLG